MNLNLRSQGLTEQHLQTTYERRLTYSSKSWARQRAGCMRKGQKPQKKRIWASSTALKPASQKPLPIQPIRSFAWTPHQPCRIRSSSRDWSHDSYAAEAHITEEERGKVLDLAAAYQRWIEEIFSFLSDTTQEGSCCSLGKMQALSFLMQFSSQESL
jgi:hypothetical protein